MKMRTKKGQPVLSARIGLMLKDMQKNPDLYKTGWQFRIGKIGKIGSASANFPIGRNSVGRAVKFCRQNRGIGKIGGSAKSAVGRNRQIGKIGRSAKVGENAQGVHLKNTRARRHALIGGAPDSDSTTHTHIYHTTTPNPNSQIF
jgi:hypothetical protein